MKFKRPALLSCADASIDLPTRGSKRSGAGAPIDSTDPLSALKTLLQKKQSNLNRNNGGPSVTHPPSRKADSVARNRGIEDRASRDEHATSNAASSSDSTAEERKVVAALKAKALLYDQLMSSSSSASSSVEDVLTASSSCLVDVSKRRKLNALLEEHHQGGVAENVTEDEAATTREGDSVDMVEVVDEFGRTRSFSRHSRVYKDLLLKQDLQRRTQGAAPRVYSSHVGGFDQGSSSRDGSSWAWSRGSAPEADEYHQEREGNRVFSSLIKDAVEREYAEMGKGAGRVKQMWETVLESSARTFINEVHQETQQARAHLKDRGKEL